MKCFVCGAEMTPYFKTTPEINYLESVNSFEYVRCENCGLVVSKTIYEMSHEDWEKINDVTFKNYFNNDKMLENFDPRWSERIENQAELFSNLVKCGVLKKDLRTIDYGAGEGSLANKINEKIGKVWLKKFDAYMKPTDENYLSADEVKPSSFDFLLTTSVFEHLIGTHGDVDNIINLIKPDGIMALHTLICEEVPKNPDWFYIASIVVHCTIWTNKAMEIIYKKFGFKGCAYHLESRIWLMFRNVDDFQKLKNVAAKLKGTWTFSNNFVDYWKVKLY